MSDLKTLVKETYQETIRNGEYPPDLKKFLQTHERKILFFNNIVREFNNPGFKNVSREVVIKITRDMTHVFVMAAKRRADEINMSAIERGLLKDKAAKAKEMRRLGDAMDALEKTNVTQDKAGNETSKSEIKIGEGFI